MSTVTGMGTTYNLPNYAGPLFQITPSDTPLLSAIGGLTGGKSVTSVAWEWQGEDLRPAGQNVALEGADAPTAQERARSNVSNVVQIHHEAVSVSYTKSAATGQKSGVNNDQANPVLSEVDHQTQNAIKTVARDVEWSFINGLYQAPTDNTTPRKSRGLFAAITTNLTANETSTVTGLSASTDTITETSTGLSNGDKIVFTDVGASTAITFGRTYYVVNKSTNAFKVAATSGGSAITIGTATVSYRKPWTTTLGVPHINTLVQMAYDNGGLQEGDVAVLLTNTTQKLALSTAFASAYGKYVESSRNIAGVNVKQIETDVCTLNVMLNRHVPQDALAVVSLEQLAPVFLEEPGKGHFYAEPLAKTGASNRVQIYGEIGLEYGNEKSHAALTGLAV